MSSLVVGIDFSPGSDLAVRRAILLAKDAGYDLHLVYVFENSSLRATPKGSDNTRMRLAGLQRKIFDADGVSCQTDVRGGDVAQELASAATEVGAEFIVVGPHAKAMLRDWFSGSTAERIIAHAKTTLIVANSVPDDRWRRCLVPVDFGDAARRAADGAFSFPFLSESLVIFAHIFDAEAREMMGRALVSGVEREDYLRRETEAAHAKLSEFVDGLGRGQTKLVVRANGGSIARDLEKVGSDEEADLIILSSSNKGAIEHAIVGSVTEDFLRSATLDIMVVPSNGTALVGSLKP